jgi:hypothetical protein
MRSGIVFYEFDGPKSFLIKDNELDSNIFG